MHSFISDTVASCHLVEKKELDRGVPRRFVTLVLDSSIGGNEDSATCSFDRQTTRGYCTVDRAFTKAECATVLFDRNELSRRVCRYLFAQPFGQRVGKCFDIDTHDLLNSQIDVNETETLTYVFGRHYRHGRNWQRMAVH